MTPIYFFILATLLFVNLSNALPNRRSSRSLMDSVWMGEYCTRDSDCDFAECCVFTPDRYSIPSCRLLQDENSMCIPNASRTNITLYYPVEPPGISALKLFNVHRNLCPCIPEAQCNSEGICAGNTIE